MKRRIQPQTSAFAGVLIALFGLSGPADAAKPPILVAAFEGDLPSIRAEIEAGTDLDTHNAKGLTALMLASGRGHLPVMAALLKAGANIDAQSKHGWSALWLAAAKGQTEAVQVLVEAGANREAQDQLERPPLWLAAARGHVGVVRALLKAGAKTNTRSSDGGNALMVAAYEGHPEVVRLLLKAGAWVNSRERRSLVSPLMYAAEQGDPETVRVLLDAGAHLDARSDRGWTYLRTRSRKPEFVEQLYGPERHGTHPTVEQVYSRVFYPKSSPYCYRWGDDDDDCVIPTNRLGFGRDGWTALIVAAANGHAEVVRVLLSSGAPMNMKSYSDATPLAYAWAKKRTEVIRVLSAMGAEKSGELVPNTWWGEYH